VGIFPEGEDSRGDHGLGRLVEIRFKGPPGIKSPDLHKPKKKVPKTEGIHWNTPQLDTVIAKLHIYSNMY